MDALNKIGQAAADISILMKKYSDRENLRAAQEAYRTVQNADSAFVSQYGGQEEFDPMVVYDENFIEVADSINPDGDIGAIPAHKIYAEWRTKNYENAVSEAAKTIPDSRLREEFLSKQETARLAIYSDDAVRATKAQIAYITKQDIAQTEQALLQQDFNKARLIIATSQMPDERKVTAYKDISTREQYDYFYSTLKNRQIPDMEKALNQLIQRDESTTSNIPEQDQKVFANELRHAIDQEGNAINATVTASYKLQADDLRNQIDDIQSNRPITPERLKSMLKNIDDLQGKYPVLAREAVWTLRNKKTVDDIVWKGRGEDRAALESLRAEPTGAEEHAYLIRQTEAALDNKDRLLQTDPIKWAQDTKFATFEPLDTSTPERIGVSLKKRLPGVQSILSGQGAYKGFLTNAEYNTLGTVIENQTVDENLRTFGSINVGVGKNFAPSIYEKLKENGVAGTAAIAGQIMASHPEKRETARKILEGAELRKENLVVQQQIKDNGVKETAVAKFGTLFAGNPRHQGLMVEAFMDVYAVTKDIDSAFTELVGNTVDLGDGFLIQVPDGISARTYQRRLENLPMSYWESDEMRVEGITPRELRDAMVDGTLKQVGVEDGGVLLVTPSNTVVTKPGGKEAFIFSMDWATPTTPEIRTIQGRIDRGNEAQKKRQAEQEFLKEHPNATRVDFDWYWENQVPLSQTREWDREK
jgi:hypothetical protein